MTFKSPYPVIIKSYGNAIAYCRLPFFVMNLQRKLKRKNI